MEFYLAPMEGLTTFIYRNTYARHFGGITKYFAPFIGSRHMSTRDIRDITPEHNSQITLIPQVLTNKVEDFLSITEQLRDYGYDKVNLNLGCPSGTVVAKHRGAGFLEAPVALERFLYEIYEKCPMQISIKTRLGIEELSEWETLYHLYSQYPLEELIVHPRLQKEYYTGRAHVEAFSELLSAYQAKNISIPLCYNGDIVSPETFERVTSVCPEISHFMIGRGILQKPWLLQTLSGQEFSITIQKVKAFHDELLDAYCELLVQDTPVLFKMKDVWTHMSRAFADSEKYLKQIRKASRISEYRVEVARLFRETTLIDNL